MYFICMWGVYEMWNYDKNGRGKYFLTFSRVKQYTRAKNVKEVLTRLLISFHCPSIWMEFYWEWSLVNNNRAILLDRLREFDLTVSFMNIHTKLHQLWIIR